MVNLLDRSNGHRWLWIRVHKKCSKAHATKKTPIKKSHPSNGFCMNENFLPEKKIHVCLIPRKKLLCSVDTTSAISEVEMIQFTATQFKCWCWADAIGIDLNVCRSYCGRGYVSTSVHVNRLLTFCEMWCGMYVYIYVCIMCECIHVICVWVWPYRIWVNRNSSLPLR